MQELGARAAAGDGERAVRTGTVADEVVAKARTLQTCRGVGTGVEQGAARHDRATHTPVADLEAVDVAIATQADHSAGTIDHCGGSSVAAVGQAHRTGTKQRTGIDRKAARRATADEEAGRADVGVAGTDDQPAWVGAEVTAGGHGGPACEGDEARNDHCRHRHAAHREPACCH